MKYPPKLEALCRQWWDALDKGTPDYSVYASEDYIEDTRICYETLSKVFLSDIVKYGVVDDMEDVNTVVDLGCGIGLSTAHLKRIFPKARVVGTNIEGTPQTEVARIFGEKEGYEVLPLEKVGHADLVFASEYFEHFYKPIVHLADVLFALEKPRYFLISNRFVTPYRSIGHFPRYEDEDEQWSGVMMNFLFNNAMSKAGYGIVKTSLPGQRPAYWKR